MLNFLQPPHEGVVLDSAWGEHTIDVLTYAMTLPGLRALSKSILGSQDGRLKLGRVVTCHATRGAFDYLRILGVTLLRCPRLHAKALLVPNLRQGAVGSFNITHKAFHSNFETFVRVEHGDYADLAAAFEAVIRQSTPFQQSDLAQVFPPELVEDDQFAVMEPALDLHPFQEKLVNQAVDRLGRKPFSKGELLKLPTGAGKTLVAAMVVKEFAARHPEKQVLWFCHRREVLDQAQARVAAQLGSASNNVVFQTRGKSQYALSTLRPKGVSLVVVDEAHLYHRKSKGYDRVEKFRKGAIPLLGLTATPPAPEKHGFSFIWNHKTPLGVDVSIEWLREQGYLARLEPVETLDTGFKFVFDHRRGRRLTEFDLAQKVRDFDHPAVNKAVAAAWQDYRRRGLKRCLAFAVSIKQCETLRDKYFQGDESVKVVHSGTSWGENRATLDWFKTDPEADDGRMLVSVLKLTEGVDVPKVDALFLVRPTFSATLHDQMIGRGLRGPKAGGTDKCAVVDFTYSFEVRGGAEDVEQVTTRQEAEGLSIEIDLDDVETSEPDDVVVEYLPVPETVGQARRQMGGYDPAAYYNHVARMLEEERQTEVDDRQVRAVVRSRLSDVLPFPIALKLYSRTGKARIPGTRAMPRTGRSLRRWLEEADAAGLSIDAMAQAIGVAPTTIRQYQSIGRLPQSFVRRLQQLKG